MNKSQVFNRIEYIVSCVGEFSMRYGLTNSQAYAYLRRFAGIDFLLESYEAEHTLSIDDAVNDCHIYTFFDVLIIHYTLGQQQT